MSRKLLFIALCIILNISYSFSIEATADDLANEKYRKALGVYTFSSTDFPAMFGIIAGVSIILIIGIIFIVVGLLTMEPAKDSIIYRMTTTRMKKD